MDMFSTPALSFRSSENQESVMRKDGPAKALQRKPFLDRPVNSKTPMLDKFSIGTHLGKPVSTPKKQLSPEPKENLDAHEYIFSYKDKEHYDCEIWPKSPLLGTEGIIKILKNYCNKFDDTPPPSPIDNSLEIDPIFMEISVKIPKTCKDVYFENIDEVDVPHFEESFNF